MDWRVAVEGLQGLVSAVVADGIRDAKSFREWKGDNAVLVADALGYTRLPGMPDAKDLVGMQFHPDLPLVILNYTQAAFAGLKDDPLGWTPGLRLCRGIVFDRGADLIAFPYEKFFNHGSVHPEASVARDSEFVATLKLDGHLGIVFRYDGQFLITTRGTFTHHTSVIGQSMLDEVVETNCWHERYPRDTTLLVEVIHKDTEVHISHGDTRQLIVTGARNVRTLEDYDAMRVQSLAHFLGLPSTKIWGFRTLAEMERFIRDPANKGIEGFVARFSDGHRLKFKCVDYLGRMYMSKMSYPYVMNRVIEGDLDDRLAVLHGPDRRVVRGLLDRAMAVALSPGTQKERWTRLYGLLARSRKYGGTSAYAKQRCREFIKFIDNAD